MDFLSRLAENISRLEQQSGKIIVQDGKMLGTGLSEKSNMITGTTVSKDPTDAKHQELYENSVLGKLEGDLTEEEIEAIVEKHINSIVNSLFEGV